jgi:hypothetical protein
MEIHIKRLDNSIQTVTGLSPKATLKDLKTAL